MCRRERAAGCGRVKAQNAVPAHRVRTVVAFGGHVHTAARRTRHDRDALGIRLTESVRKTQQLSGAPAIARIRRPNATAEDEAEDGTRTIARRPQHRGLAAARRLIGESTQIAAEYRCAVNRPHVVAARPQHPLAGRKKLQLKDLEGYAWLVPYSRPADLDVIVETFVAGNLEPPRRIVGSDAYRIGMQLLLSSDLLIMVSPNLIAPELAKRPVVLQVLDIDRPTVQRNASLIHPSDRPLTPPAALLLDEVRKVALQASRPAVAGAAVARN